MPNADERRSQEWTSGNPEQPLTESSRFVPLLGLRASVLDDETLVVDPLQNRYFRLNRSGSAIWDGAVKGASIGEIAEQFASFASLEPAAAYGTVTAFIQQLEAAQLLYRPSPT